MARRKYSDCSASQAKTRLDHAVLYLDVARLVIADEPGSEAIPRSRPSRGSRLP